jgi:hypothetical protein
VGDVVLLLRLLRLLVLQWLIRIIANTTDPTAAAASVLTPLPTVVLPATLLLLYKAPAQLLHPRQLPLGNSS